MFLKNNHIYRFFVTDSKRYIVGGLLGMVFTALLLWPTVTAQAIQISDTPMETLAAILNEEPTLDRYYAARVIGGAGAFLITANNFDDYRRAIRIKLIREISTVPMT